MEPLAPFRHANLGDCVIGETMQPVLQICLWQSRPARDRVCQANACASWSSCAGAAMQWALQALPEEARARYQRRGKKWKAGIRQVDGDRVRTLCSRPPGPQLPTHSRTRF